MAVRLTGTNRRIEGQMVDLPQTQMPQLAYWPDGRRGLPWTMAVNRAARRGALASLLVAACLMSPSSAESATTDCGSQLTQFTGYGYYLGSPSYVGTRASIVARNMALCSTVTDPHFNFTYTWVMIANFDGTSGWAQSGFYRGYGQSAVHAVEDNPDGTFLPPRRRYIGHPVYGTAYNYEVRPGTSAECLSQPGGVVNCMVELVQGTIYQATNFAPSSRWTTPYANEYFGETKFPGSDMPGTSTARTTFSSIDVYSPGVGFIGSAPQNSVSNENPRSHLTSYSNSSFSLWSG